MVIEKVRRILIVDNDENFLTRLQVLFEDRDYQTTVAWGGRELLSELQSKQFDLILVSDYLPDTKPEEFWQVFAPLTGSASVALIESDPPVKKMTQQYLQVGGHCVLSKAAPHNIMEMVRGCLNAGENHQVNRAGASSKAMRQESPAVAGQNAG